MNTYMNGGRQKTFCLQESWSEDWGGHRVGKLSFCNLAVKTGSDKSPPWMLDLGGNPDEEQEICMVFKRVPRD